MSISRTRLKKQELKSTHGLKSRLRALLEKFFLLRQLTAQQGSSLQMHYTSKELGMMTRFCTKKQRTMSSTFSMGDQ
ncbi:hypothetical protein GBA52_016164 [Prunus armeniaca]|nr:hypothetical protein GBA52_016164 [Prunus armeniaca]